jgi:hypothetical protein
MIGTIVWLVTIFPFLSYYCVSVLLEVAPCPALKKQNKKTPVYFPNFLVAR